MKSNYINPLLFTKNTHLLTYIINSKEEYQKINKNQIQRFKYN